jgi:hypothetical protein
MVAAGVTVLEPFRATVPMFWLMEAEVALVVVQLKVDDWPLMIEIGLAAKVTVGGGVVTVTLALAVREPLLFLTVMV